MITSRFPPSDASSFAKPQSVELDPGQKATMEWSPERSGSTFYLSVVGISKISDSTYSIQADGRPIFGEAAIPPTDIDNTVPIWDPPKTFEDTLTVEVKNLGDGTQTYHAQPVGFETSQGVE